MKTRPTIALAVFLAFMALGVYTPAAYGQETDNPPIEAKDENDASDKLAGRYNGKREVILWDETRVDLLTPTHAIEVDWAKGSKWAEAIGQALYYAELTGKKPGIILLTEDPRADRRFIFRCQTVCSKYGIRLWIERVVKIEELPPP